MRKPFHRYDKKPRQNKLSVTVLNVPLRNRVLFKMYLDSICHFLFEFYLK